MASGIAQLVDHSFDRLEEWVRRDQKCHLGRLDSGIDRSSGMTS